jgi:hypothetical protein
MFQPRQQPALLAEALVQDRRAFVGGVQELERDLLREALVATLGQVDHAHAALAEQAQDAVVARRGGLRLLAAQIRCRRSRCERQCGGVGALDRIEHPAHLARELGVLADVLVDQRITRGRIHVHRRHRDALGLDVAIGQLPCHTTPRFPEGDYDPEFTLISHVTARR